MRHQLLGVGLLKTRIRGVQGSDLVAAGQNYEVVALGIERVVRRILQGRVVVQSLSREGSQQAGLPVQHCFALVEQQLEGEPGTLRVADNFLLQALLGGVPDYQQRGATQARGSKYQREQELGA